MSQKKCVGLLSAWQHERLPSSPKRSQLGEIKSLVAEFFGTGPQHSSPSNTQLRGLCLFNFALKNDSNILLKLDCSLCTYSQVRICS